MRNLYRKALALAALAVGVWGVRTHEAEASEGWYGRIDAGYSVEGGLEDVSNGEADLPDAEFDADWMVSAGAGYAFANGFRLEAEYSYRDNDVGEDAFWRGGAVKATALMANLYRDFEVSERLRPYVGVGVGAAKVETKASGGVITPDYYTFEGSDTVVAYQAMAGVAIGLTPRLELDVGYRYFIAPDLSFEGEITNEPAPPFEMDYTHQAVTLGLRWQFAAPAASAPLTPPLPPQGPPVAACPTSEFVVYFEWDRSNLNQDALDVIDNAIIRARECNLASATIVGHTDTSGPSAYNIGLSQRRASVVSEALIARGLPAEVIATDARGETDLARLTRDGVREPLNRRTAVTIAFQ